MKNANRIQQLFSEMVNAFALCIREADFSTLDVDLSRPGHIQDGDFVFPKPFAIKLFEVWKSAADLLEIDGSWSKDSLLEAFMKCSKEVVRGTGTNASEASSKFSSELKRQPTEFERHIAIFGLDGDYEPIQFGQIELTQLQHSSLLKGIPAETMFASVRVSAIDDQTAQSKARFLLNSHLSVINALSAEAWPSYFRLQDSYIDPMDLRMIGTVQSTGEWGGSIMRNRSIYPLPSSQLRSILESEPAKRAGLAMKSNDEVSRRIRAGYEMAGNACSTVDPSTAFVLFAIALESSVMGGASNEITHQLAMRVAHLVSETLPERKTTARLLKNLYGIRSKIVHRGETDVTNREVNEIRMICLNSLNELSALATREQMIRNEDITGWFENCMLGRA